MAKERKLPKRVRGTLAETVADVWGSCGLLSAMLGYGRYFSLDVLILSVVALLAIQLIEKARVMWLTLRAAWTPPLVARLLTPAVAWHKCTDAELCAVDGAPPEVQARRRAGLAALARRAASLEGPRSRELSELLRHLADGRFTDNRLLPQFLRRLSAARHAVEPAGPLLASSHLQP